MGLKCINMNKRIPNITLMEVQSNSSWMHMLLWTIKEHLILKRMHNRCLISEIEPDYVDKNNKKKDKSFLNKIV